MAQNKEVPPAEMVKQASKLTTPPEDIETRGSRRAQPRNSASDQGTGPRLMAISSGEGRQPTRPRATTTSSGPPAKGQAMMHCDFLSAAVRW
jgi:hypothetical protein